MVPKLVVILNLKLLCSIGSLKLGLKSPML
nr:MAG TPA: hypothetical protein [Caudoviricetes sp.]DAX72829.1 MAG TPA: hypothetical protein [Caudoviricetes sp.]